ncbi:TOM70 [Mytilus edulis]|uniref:TOM70 n=1 Tax=Mytilus edulis TaxID=6550 RepID=A0A8S3U2T2_MYTED|nr:TOM70 [Mytilus edulis]
MTTRLDPDNADIYHYRGHVSNYDNKRLDPDNADIYHYRGHVSNYDNKRLDPDNADIYHHRGHVSNYDNKRLDPDNADIYHHRGHVSNYDNKRLDPDNADIYHHRGHVSNYDNKRLDPDNADIYHHRGHVSNYDNKRLDPDNADIYHHRGHVSNYGNKRLDPDNADIYHYRGHVSNYGNKDNGHVSYYDNKRLDPDNADIYHHRGHHNIQLDRVDDAIRDLEFAVSKCPAFAASHVQKSFAEHRKSAEMIANSGAKIPLPQTVIDSYKNNVTMFPDNGDARALYAQALTDAGKFDEADREFEKAIKLEPDNATAMVHRGLLQLQWKQDVEEAIKIINQAIDVDNKCEYAYEVLGTLEVQRSNMQKAMDLFQKAIHLSRTESEMAHLYSLLDAAHAQLKVAKNLGITLPGPMGMGMP